MPITAPAASALSDEIDKPSRLPLSRMNGATVKRCKEAVDHRRDAGKNLEKRFRDRAKSGMRVFGEIDGRHQTDRNGNQHRDKTDEGCPSEDRNRSERTFRGDLIFAQCDLRAPFQTKQELEGRYFFEEPKGF